MEARPRARAKLRRLRTSDDTAGAPTRLPRWLAIALVSLAGLLLEVGYTRIVSYKLWYYYTYLVIGLALLGIGCGGIVVVLWSKVRHASTDSIVAGCSIWGAVSIAAGYFLIARLPVNTVKIWDYGSAGSYGNFALLTLICFTLFVTFVALGIIVATLLGRAGDGVGRLYFADLVGAGVGCFMAVPLISRLGPPAVVILAALVFAVVGVLSMPRRLSPDTAFGALLALVLAVGVVGNESLLPDIRPEAGKLNGSGASFSEWGPVFRVDVLEVTPDSALLLHDGTFGSGIWRFDGDAAALTRYDVDPRAIPFRVLGGPPARELIVGSAGGNEILASLHFGATDIEAVELNPVTVSLLTDHYADYTGNLPDRPEVDLHQGDARSYLARNDTTYDLIWYVAPDSYAANNAASSGAFVLSESYLYTTEMIEKSLEHMSDRGVMVAQFGEVDFAGSPNRTSRYVVTAREALERIGVADPSQHIAVALQPIEGISDLATVVVKRTPFTPEEVAGFTDGLGDLSGTVPIYAPGRDFGGHVVAQLAGGTDAEVEVLVDSHYRDISAISDDAPFFWHFTGFGDVISEIFDPISVVDPEDAIGERVLLLLLVLATVFAAVFLLVPFLTVRREWAAFPVKRLSTVYFAALGLGFMFFEITMIQRLVLFLGYPTYSLTVTLASILVSTGAGAYLSGRFVTRASRLMPGLLAVLALLTIFYQFGLESLTEALLTSGLAVRVVVALLVLAPLGLCLGMFMPLGLGLVARLSEHPQQYVAWAWAVNGFASVVGSVLTTILSMTYGFRTVQFVALGVYAVAVVVYLALQRAAGTTVNATVDERPAELAAATARPT